MPFERPHATSYVLAIAMFVPFVTVWEIITYALHHVFDSNLLPWNWRSRTLTIWMKIGWRTYLVNMHVCKNWRSQVQPFVCSTSSYIVWWMDERTYLVNMHVCKNWRSQVQPFVLVRHRTLCDGWTNVPCQHSCVQELAFTGPAVCFSTSSYIVWWIDERTYKQTHSPIG